MAYGGEIVIKTKLETKDFEKEFDDLKKHYDSESIQSFVDSYETASEKAKRLKEEEREASKAAKEIADNTEEIVEETKKSTVNVDNLGKSFKKSIKSVGQLVLGIFGIRSAYLALRRASNDLAQYDEQYATNLEYIRFVLTQAIAPVLRAIVNMAGHLLQYIVNIVQTLFGMKGVENSSVEAFNKMKNKAGGVSKTVKEIKKQLTGFDEINILTDQSSSSAGGGGTNQTTMPDFGKKPEWLEKIAPTIAGIAAAVLALKSHLGAIKALGIGIMVKGIIDLISSLKDYLEDPSWENFGRVIQAIGEIIVGFGILIGSVPAIVTGAIVLIVGTIVKYWDQIKEFFQKGIDWLAEKSDWIHNVFGETIGEAYDAFVRAIQHALNFFDSIFTSIKGILDGIIQLVKGVFTGDWKKAWEGIKTIFSNLWGGILGILKNGIGFIEEMLVAIGKAGGGIIASAFKVVVNAVLGAVETILNKPINTINSLIGTINKVPGINITRLNTFNLPRLAVGGIVNMPNRGTMIGGAIAGESGAEGVIPLTDRQAMETLGEAIGRYITINANIINRMNGRTLSREIVQVQNDQSFAYNS